MKVFLAQFAVQRADRESNLNLIRKMASEASRCGADMMVLPEMATTGFDWNYNREVISEVRADVSEIAELARTNQISIMGSLLRGTSAGEPANSLLYFDASGIIRAEYRKIHLFTLFEEDRHMVAGETPVVLDAAPATLGFSICYDLRFPELYRRTTEMGAESRFCRRHFLTLGSSIGGLSFVRARWRISVSLWR